MDFGDGMIAATAIELGLRLWTKNFKHYPDPRIQFFA
jgi:predicted nucleic acid-binding protein